MIATHMDADHISGIGELLETGYPMENLLLPDGQETDDLAAFAGIAEYAGVKVVYFQRGESIEFPGGTNLWCLHPFDGFETEDTNAASLVFHLEYDGFDALFTGDLEASGEDALCRFFEEERQEMGWEVLKVAHHGSKYSTGDAFLERISPRAALISAGENNRYGHPHKETLKRLEDCGTDIFMTAERGAIFVETDGERWGMRTFCGER